MLVDMYRIENPDAGIGKEIGNVVRKVQLNFKGSPGSLGQRLLVDLQNPGNFIAVSYWLDKESLANAKELHAALDKAVGRFNVKTTMTNYLVVQEL